MKIVITGGHHNSALAVAEALRDKSYQIVWIGHRHTMIGDPHDSLEYQEVVAAGFPFVSLLAGKFHSRAHPVHLLRIPLGFIHALLVLSRIRPQLILGFGGYVALPIALAGKLLGIPLIAFEQTTTIGRANQIIGKIAEKNFLTWESSLPHFPVKNSQVVGLPLRRQLWTQKPKQWFSGKRPVVFITGGKQGAHVINQAIFKLLPQLLRHYNVIHQTGASVKTKDFARAEKLRENLPAKLRQTHECPESLEAGKVELVGKVAEGFDD